MPSPSFFAPPMQARLVPLPPPITRSFIPTPSGVLELLSAEPAVSTPRKTAVFFAHGGCGSAAVWREWMLYLSQTHGVPCYAVSYRGHGASWYPWYLRMYFTSARTLAGDLVAGVEHVQELERARSGGEGRVVLVAHSNGGGLAQIALDAGLVKVRGLALVAATPCYGSIGVNRNWSILDKWFMPRMYFRHLGNPMSPLSSNFLVKQAFFSAAFPYDKVEAFRRNMPTYESFLWPLNLMFSIASPLNVLGNVIGSTGKESKESLLLMAGEEDKLMSLDLMEGQAAEYRSVSEKGKAGETALRFEVVRGAGHHLQNDLQWEDGASVLYDWYEKL